MTSPGPTASRSAPPACSCAASSPGFQYDLAIVLAAVAASNGRPDDAATIAGLAAAAVPAMHTAAIATMLGPLLPDGAPGSIVDAGSAPLVDAIRYATRGRARRVPQRFGWQSLTPTERSVVTLACEGLTNAAIGRRLHVGAGTVKTHLSHIYAKLGIANRTELATAAAQRAGVRGPPIGGGSARRRRHTMRS